eukprot:TRINITY_DN1537_c0_g1_i3.p2 TRINITY_DN1537_c0_g1~~TRINITY_DN1537_c0_g1_i3.p2  ORF type:complete len:249 (+),score=54.97 TRINITY_DN1537_c0_g1_i3:94-747(+)
MDDDENAIEDNVASLFKEIDVEPEAIARMKLNISPKAGRAAFVKALAGQRSRGMELTLYNFNMLVSVMERALADAEGQLDFGNAKDLLLMASTFFCIESESRVYLMDHLQSISLWQREEFWVMAFYAELEREKAKKDLVYVDKKSFSWSELSEEAREEIKQRESGLVFGLLGTFSQFMLSSSLDPQTVKAFISKQAKISELPPSDVDLLLQQISISV